MDPSLREILAALSLAAGVQGLFLAALLWRSGSRQVANRWLAYGTAVLALLMVWQWLDVSRLILRWPHLAHLADPLVPTLGPAVWLYVRRLTGDERPLPAGALGHLLPALLLAAVFLPLYLLDGDTKRALLRDELAHPEPDPIAALLAVQTMAYLAAALVRTRRFAARAREQFSDLSRRDLGWLRMLLGAALAVWAVWAASVVTDVPALWVLDRLAVPMAIFGLAYAGLFQPVVRLAPHLALDPAPPASGPSPPPEVAPAVPPGSPERSNPGPPMEPPAARRAAYARSGLGEGRARAYLRRLEALMTAERPYLDPDLKLPELARRSGIPPAHLSQVLNERLGTSFYDYVNAHRVAEVRRLLRDPARAKDRLLELAFASGFNSKSTFNKVFKATLGTTPAAYRLADQADGAAGVCSDGSDGRVPGRRGAI